MKRIVISGVLMIMCMNCVKMNKNEVSVPLVKSQENWYFTTTLQSRILEWQRRQKQDGCSFSREDIIFLLTYKLNTDENIFGRADTTVFEKVIVLNELIQKFSKVFYKKDEGYQDYWPTIQELFVTAQEGEDCDGFSLFSYCFLMEESQGMVYRAIATEQENDEGINGGSHMITLWSVEPGKFLVIDPTGAISKQVIPLVSIGEEWKIEWIFNDKDMYNEPFDNMQKPFSKN